MFYTMLLYYSPQCKYTLSKSLHTTLCHLTLPNVIEFFPMFFESFQFILLVPMPLFSTNCNCVLSILYLLFPRLTCYYQCHYTRLRGIMLVSVILKGYKCTYLPAVIFSFSRCVDVSPYISNNDDTDTLC